MATSLSRRAACSIEPDILLMAKGIANGFPLGAMIAREEIAAAFKPGDHLSTFGGNPVSCAAALANIAYLQREQLPQRARDLGERVMRIEAVAAEVPAHRRCTRGRSDDRYRVG